MKLLSVLFPAVCPICGAVISEKELEKQGFCNKCLISLSEYSEYISHDVNPNYPSCDSSYCCFKYFGQIKQQMIAYKFNDCTYLYKSFAVFMNNFLLKHDVYANIDILTYIPITPKRFAGRGYNQTELIAKELLKMNKEKFMLEELFIRRKEKDVKTSSLNLAQRKSEKFILKNNIIDLKGKRILLLDDILTTGATIEECSAILKRQGAIKVIAAVIASGRRDF